jgi:hypothetical protein
MSPLAEAWIASSLSLLAMTGVRNGATDSVSSLRTQGSITTDAA